MMGAILKMDTSVALITPMNRPMTITNNRTTHQGAPAILANAHSKPVTAPTAFWDISIPPRIMDTVNPDALTASMEANINTFIKFWTVRK
jgi:hypothetical protein